jgi:hypothetical protein
MRSTMRNSLLLRKAAIGLAIVAAPALIVYVLSVRMGTAEASSAPAADSTAADTTFGRAVENVAFGIHEKLTFDINYGFINAGTAAMEVVDLIDYENRPCYQIVSTANSNSFFSTFYKVEDRVESIIDAVGVFSWRFEKKLREGGYRADLSYTFDQERHFVHYKKDTLAVEPYVQDALSSLYFVRTQKLEVGKSLFVRNFTDGRFYPLEVIVHKKERITVKAGTFDCIVVEPILQTVGVFKHEGKLKVWLTDDRLKMPVLMKSKVLVGSISAELSDYQLGEIQDF